MAKVLGSGQGRASVLRTGSDCERSHRLHATAYERPLQVPGAGLCADREPFIEVFQMWVKPNCDQGGHIECTPQWRFPARLMRDGFRTEVPDT